MCESQRRESEALDANQAAEGHYVLASVYELLEHSGFFLQPWEVGAGLNFLSDGETETQRTSDTDPRLHREQRGGWALNTHQHGSQTRLLNNSEVPLNAVLSLA